MARRPSPAGPGWDVLIKWTNLGHEHATWEVCHQPACQLCTASIVCREVAGQDLAAEGSPAHCPGSLQHDGWMAASRQLRCPRLAQAECEGVPLNPDHQHLHNALWARQTAAIERATSEALAAAAEAREVASRQMPEFVDTAERVSTDPCA